MANENIHQVFVANPITTNASTDLMYFGQSPYGAGNDAAMTYANFAAQFLLAGSNPWSAGAGSGSAKGGNATTAAGISSLAWGASAVATNNGSFVIGDHTTHIGTDSAANQYVSSFNGGHYWYSSPSGTALLSMSINTVGQVVVGQGYCDTSYSYQTPSTGFSITGLRTSETLELNPAGTLATGTIIFPASPVDGERFRVTTTHTITALSLNGNTKTISNPVTTLLAGQGFCYQYNSAQSTWYPLYQTYIPAAGATALQVQEMAFNTAADSGVAANTYVAAYSPTITSYTGYQGVIFAISNLNATNTGASTFNGLPIILPTGAALAGNEMVATNSYAVQIQGTNAVLLNSSLAAGGASPWTAGAGTGSAIGGDGTCTAAGNYSASYGSGNTVSGLESVAFGNGNTVSGDYSAAFGQYSQATATHTYAMGYGCVAQGTGGVCIGYSSQATSAGSFHVAIGLYARARAYQSFAFGNSLYANGTQSMAFGQSCTAVNTGSVVWGDGFANTPSDTASNQYVLQATGGYYFYQNAVLSYSVDINGNFIFSKGVADQSYSLQTPSTGFSITIAAGVERLILNPAGTLASGTITMPAAPIKGQIIKISCTQIVTALTISANSGQSIVNPLGAFAAGQAVSYIYDLASTTWLPTA